MSLEAKMGPKRLPIGVPRGSQNDPKIRVGRVLGHRCGPKAPQGVPRGAPGGLRVPPEPKNGAKMAPKMAPKMEPEMELKFSQQVGFNAHLYGSLDCKAVGMVVTGYA